MSIKNLLILLIVVLGGCSDKKVQEKNNVMLTTEQILKINIQGDLKAIHPHLGIDLNCRSVQKALFEGLTRISNNSQPQLALAESVDISESKNVYIFKLRSSFWSNGASLTAHHFEKAWKAALSPSSDCLRSDLFYSIKNAMKAKKGEVPLDAIGVKAIDTMTLQVELEHPTPYFLDLVALPIFSPLFDEKGTPDVFNGPFVLENWEHEKSLTLAHNNLYWDAKEVKLQKIIFSLVHDPNTALLMYEKNELDWAGSPFTMLPPDAITPLEQKNLIKSNPVAGVFWFCLNTEKFPLNSVNIRKSLSLAIDRDAIAKHVLNGEMATTSLMPLNFMFNPIQDKNANPSLARSYFEEGLRELKITRDAFPPLVLSHSDVSGQKKVAEAVAAEWEEVLGIKVELSGFDWNTFLDNLGKKQFQIGGCIWYSTYNDPICTLSFFKERANRYNCPQWENAHYKELLDLADNEVDTNRRNQYLKEAEEVLLDEMPVIPLFISHHKYLMHDYVKGIYISPLGLVDFKWSYIDTPSLAQR